MDEPMGLLARAQLQQQFTQTKQKAEKLQVLHEIGCGITAALGLEEMLTRIVDAAVYLSGAEEGSLLLLDEKTRDLTLRAQRGLGESHARGFRIQTADSIAGAVVETNRPQRLASMGQELKVVTGYLVQSILYVPVAMKERVIGVLAVDNQRTDRPFSQDDEELLQILAGYAAIILENERLQQELTSRAGPGLDEVAPGAVCLGLKPDPEPPLAETLAPHYVANVLLPYLDALADLQGILDELEGQPRSEARILALRPGLPAVARVEGVEGAARIVAERVSPWKRSHAGLLAEVARKEGEATIETAWVEILEAQARAASGQAERDRLLAQAGQQRAEAARRAAEGQPLRLDIRWAALQLAADLLAWLAPNLSDGERLVRLARLLPALETLATSPLELVSGP